jgi:hypothetical protein
LFTAKSFIVIIGAMSAKSNRHPWSYWFSLDKFTLVRGEHYTCVTPSMIQQVRNNASRRNLNISIYVKDKEFTVVVRKKEYPGA